jgi:hypothetical protein
MQPLFSRAAAMALMCVSMLTACSPKLDWREMPVAEGRARVLFPAKPVTVTRETMLDGKGYAMTLTAARVGAAQFAAGTIPVAPADAPAVAQAWAKAMLVNVQANGEPAPATLKNAQGALETVANGTMNGKSARLHARFAWRGGQVFAAIAVGQTDELSAADAAQFAQSLVLP